MDSLSMVANRQKLVEARASDGLMYTGDVSTRARLLVVWLIQNSRDPTGFTAVWWKLFNLCLNTLQHPSEVFSCKLACAVLVCLEDLYIDHARSSIENLKVRSLNQVQGEDGCTHLICLGFGPRLSECMPDPHRISRACRP